jgi:hypothetical protein
MRKIMMQLACASLLTGLTALSIAAQPGLSDMRFNRKFIPAIKPNMSYQQMVKIVGAPGVKVREDKKGSPPSTQYRWKGSRDSVLTVRFVNNKLFDATILTPNKRSFFIRNNGEVVERQ